MISGVGLAAKRREAGVAKVGDGLLGDNSTLIAHTAGPGWPYS